MPVFIDADAVIAAFDEGAFFVQVAIAVGETDITALASLLGGDLIGADASFVGCAVVVAAFIFFEEVDAGCAKEQNHKRQHESDGGVG